MPKELVPSLIFVVMKIEASSGARNGCRSSLPNNSNWGVGRGRIAGKPAFILAISLGPQDLNPRKISKLFANEKMGEASMTGEKVSLVSVPF